MLGGMWSTMAPCGSPPSFILHPSPKVIQSSRHYRHLLGSTIDGLHHNTSNSVRVGVRCWSSILEVSVTLSSALSWDTDRGTTVGNAVAEGVDGASLVSAGKTEGVILTVNSDVLLVAALKLLDSSLDCLHASLLAHLGAGEIAVKTSSVPVSWNWLGVEGDLGTEFLSNTLKKETSNPKLITHCKSRQYLFGEKECIL